MPPVCVFVDVGMFERIVKGNLSLNDLSILELLSFFFCGALRVGTAPRQSTNRLSGARWGWQGLKPAEFFLAPTKGRKCVCAYFQTPAAAELWKYRRTQSGVNC